MPAAIGRLGSCLFCLKRTGHEGAAERTWTELCSFDALLPRKLHVKLIRLHMKLGERGSDCAMATISRHNLIKVNAAELARRHCAMFRRDEAPQCDRRVRPARLSAPSE